MNETRSCLGANIDRLRQEVEDVVKYGLDTRFEPEVASTLTTLLNQFIRTNLMCAETVEVFTNKFQNLIHSFTSLTMQVFTTYMLLIKIEFNCESENY